MRPVTLAHDVRRPGRQNTVSRSAVHKRGDSATPGRRFRRFIDGSQEMGKASSDGPTVECDGAV